MKLALFGSSPIALEAALRFHSHEAALTWFNEEEEVRPFFSSPHVSWQDCTTDLGRDVLRKLERPLNDGETFSWQKWRVSYYLPLVEFLKSYQDVKSYRLLSVTKRFLGPEEEIQGRSRFHDLFRIIYQLNPEEFIDQQKGANPETYQRLSEEFMQSLQSSLEMYEDFDLVLDLREGTMPLSASVAGRVLGEGRIGKEYISCGVDALKKALGYSSQSEVRELILIGSGDLACEILIQLEGWLTEPRNRLFVVSAEEDPFSAFMDKARDEVRNKIHKLWAKMESEFDSEVNDFHRQLREWQELDDFIQVKKPRPVEPVPRLVFFSGHNVTAMDQLIDKRRLFVTLEKPDWRKGLRQPENNHLDLKTIGVDEVLVANGVCQWPISEHLRKQEPGHFYHEPVRPSFNEGWKEDLDALDKIEESIFKLFSPVAAAEL